MPKMSIEEWEDFIGKRRPERLIEAGMNQLWQSSAGTCGELSTALLKSFWSDG